MTADWDPVASKEVVETVTITGVNEENDDDSARRMLVLMVVAGIVGTLLNGWLLARWFARRKRRS